MRQTTLPLGQDPSSRYLPWIIGLMTFLASLSITAGLSLNKLSGSWVRELGNYLTIEAPAAINGKESIQTEQEYKIHEAVQSFSRIGPIKSISAQKILGAVTGEVFTEEDIGVLPKIYEVKLNGAPAHEISALREKLKAISDEIRLEDHRQTRNTMGKIAKSIQVISISIVMLIILGAISIIAFTAQTSLIIHRNVIEILYLVGATPSYIARQFQSHATSVGMQSFIINIVLGIFLVTAVKFFSEIVFYF
ncbi:MAG: hypothetical protein H6925_05535 [Holosporaceae bacterium]|nr:MAG: hypothetical protein H6925_05535 [Holosporaceae bacterium]